MDTYSSQVPPSRCRCPFHCSHSYYCLCTLQLEIFKLQVLLISRITPGSREANRSAIIQKSPLYIETKNLPLEAHEYSESQEMDLTLSPINPVHVLSSCLLVVQYHFSSANRPSKRYVPQDSQNVCHILTSRTAFYVHVTANRNKFSL